MIKCVDPRTSAHLPPNSYVRPPLLIFEDQIYVIGLIEILIISKRHVGVMKLVSLELPTNSRIFPIHHPCEFIPKGGT